MVRELQEIETASLWKDSPSLAENAETVRAAGAATALLLENQRLDAELRAHIVGLRASRARIVEAADSERRRIERNLTTARSRGSSS